LQKLQLNVKVQLHVKDMSLVWSERD